MSPNYRTKNSENLKKIRFLFLDQTICTSFAENRYLSVVLPLRCTFWFDKGQFPESPEFRGALYTVFGSGAIFEPDASKSYFTISGKNAYAAKNVSDKLQKSPS